MQTTTSRFGYADTIARLIATIEASGNRIFATLDQAAAATGAGLELRPTTLIVFGNPAGGSRVMADFPLFALELPLRLLVWQDAAGAVTVAHVSMRDAAARYGLPDADARILKMDEALATLAASVAT